MKNMNSLQAGIAFAAQHPSVRNVVKYFFRQILLAKQIPDMCRETINVFLVGYNIKADEDNYKSSTPCRIIG